MEILTVEDYTKIQGLNRPDVSPNVKAAITAANAFVTRWLNFTEEDEYIEVHDNRQKYFVSPMVSAITSIKDLDDNDIIYPYKYIGNGTIYFPANLPRAGMYKVSATYGSFNSGGVPEDMKQAVAMLVDYWVKKEYLESRSFGGETSQYTTKTTGIPTHVRSILELYRNY